MCCQINYGEEWTSSQTFNCFVCIFSGKKTFFLFNKLKISTVIDLVENFKSERLYCKISVSKMLGRGTHSRNGNKPNTRNKNIFPIKRMQRCSFWCVYKIQIQIFNCQTFPGLTQPVSRAASATVESLRKTSLVLLILL